uniref:Zinc finger GRF-type domain-containing protein n=1 Tax=Oryza nivara TaxID=4536 RepID=A0A0E0GUF4_ORYNI
MRGNPNPRGAMQRRYAAGSEDFGMSQGCSFPARLPVGSSDLPLIRCPRCGAAVVECRSMRHGGKVFFKCEENEQDVPNCCKFFKWIESYRKMVEGMSEHVVDEGPSDVAVVDGSIEMKRSSVDDGKIDKLINLIKVLVMINIGMLFLGFIGVFVMILK